MVGSAAAITLKGPSFVNNIQGMLSAYDEIRYNYDNAYKVLNQMESLSPLTVDISGN